MKITPIEIRQKTFEKVFRGYEKEEVNAFLLSLSQEWERLVDDNKELKIKLDIAEKEVKKLREVESSLYKTLKTAEDTGTHLIEQANRSADLRLQEAQRKSDSLISDAHTRAKSMITEADNKAKQILEEMLNELRTLERDFRSLEGQKENLIIELKGVVNETLDRVNRMDARQNHISLDSKIREVRNLIDQKAELTFQQESTPALPQSQEESEPILLPADSSELTSPAFIHTQTETPVDFNISSSNALSADENQFEQTEPAPASEPESIELQREIETPVAESVPVPQRERDNGGSSKRGSFFDELDG